MEPIDPVKRASPVDFTTAWFAANTDDAASRAEVADVADVEVPLTTFDDFYRTSRSELVRALSLTLGDVELATEAVDEAMTRAYQRWDRVHCLDNPAGWVYRVGFNWAVSVLRRRKNRRTLFTREPDGMPWIEPDVHRALGELSVDHRSVVVCRYLFGWSENETATALGIRAGTVKSRLHRATSQLRVRLDHLRPEESS
jgi:RNA polymerase sigma factor (sigma-70 family)